MSKYINTGYTDKLSYTNKEIIRLFIDPYYNIKNIYLDIKDLNGNIIKKIFVKEMKKQVKEYRGEYNIPIFEKYKEPWYEFNYEFTCSFKLNNVKSGIYIIDDKINVIIKEDYNSFNRAFICYLVPTNTIEMYNVYGGKSGYYDFRNEKNIDPHNAARVLDMKRPKNLTKLQNGILKWFLNSNYKINYITDVDMDQNIYNCYWSNSVGHSTKLLIIGGHSEYWSMKARKNLEEIISNGTHLLNLSGNSLWSRISYADNYSKLIHVREDRYINQIPKKYLSLSETFKTVYFCDKINNYRSFETIGVDYLIGGWGCKLFNNKNHPIKYFNYSKSSVLNNISYIDILSSGDEYDGIYTNLSELYDVKTDDILKYFNKIKLSNKYKIFKHKKLLMVGFCTYPHKEKKYIARITGIIALQKNDISGIIINCCSSHWCEKKIFDEKKKKLTGNFIEFLLNNKNINNI